MEFISHIVDTMNGFLWGPPLLILIVGTGIYLIQAGFFAGQTFALLFKARLFKASG